MSQQTKLKPHALTAKGSRRRQLFSGSLLALVSICATLLILEIAARFLPWPYDTTIGELFICDPKLGWMGQPNYEGTIEGANFQQAITFNAGGMHDGEHPFDKPPNTFRILMLGDSFVQAVQVDETATAHQFLEDYLNQEGSKAWSQVEVISGGVVNWGTNHQLIYYREHGRHVQADLVLLMFYIGNDFLDNLPGNGLTVKGLNCYAPYFAVCDGQLNPTPLTYAPGISDLQNNCSPLRRALINGLGKFYQYSRLYQQLEPLIVANRPRRVFGGAYPSAFSALYLPSDEAELEQAWRITQATIAQLKVEIEADGARLAVAVISPDIAVRLASLSPAEQEVFLRDNPKFAEANIDLPNRRLAEFLADEKIPFIDLTQPMTEHLAAHRNPLYIVGDGHWTVEGNRVAAEVLGRWLLEEGVLFEVME